VKEKKNIRHSNKGLKNESLAKVKKKKGGIDAVKSASQVVNDEGTKVWCVAEDYSQCHSF